MKGEAAFLFAFLNLLVGCERSNDANSMTADEILRPAAKALTPGITPPAWANMNGVMAEGRACGMQQIGASTDVFTGQLKIDWDPLEEGIRDKLRCLDARLAKAFGGSAAVPRSAR